MTQPSQRSLSVDTTDFRKQSRRFRLKYERTAVEVATALTKHVRLTEAESTPFLTGRARANWEANLDGFAEDTGPIGPLVEAAANRAGRVRLGGARFGMTMWVTNAVSYLRRLNAGSSRKAPANFVSLAVRKAVVSFRIPSSVSRR
jgi:hypothetical protein